MARRLALILPVSLVLAAATCAAASAASVVRGIVYAEDNVALAYDQYRQGNDSVIIICPGFYNSKENRWMRKTVDLLLPRYDVIIFDMRGHGGSGGTFTWSAKERLDVDAVADYAAAQGYRHIGIVGFSLGAAAAIAAAASRSDIDSMVLISCPSDFNAIDYHFWEPEMLSDLCDNIECKWEGKGARVASMLLRKDRPLDAVGRIQRTAMLFVHGDRDWVVKERHSKKLYDAAKGRKRLEIIRGGLHAERLIQQQPRMMARLISDWFAETL